MGSGQGKSKKKIVQQKKNQPNSQQIEEKHGLVQYDDDVIDATNLAIAIQKEDLTTNIELFIHCESLPKMDAFSLTDPMVIAFLDKDDKWIELGKTEVIPETLNPKFVRTFIVSYNFERKQKLRFECYDVDDYDQRELTENQEFIGFVECEIHDIVCAPTQSISRTIINRKSNRKRNGILHIRGSEYDIGANKILFKIGCTQFANKGDIQLKFNYLTENKDWMPIYATDPEKNQKKQVVMWKDFYLPLSKFGNDENAQLKLEVEEFNKNKGTTMLGETEMTLAQMMENQGKFIKMMKNGLITGQLRLFEVKQHSRYSFLNYIYSGAKLQIMLAVDFTNSNKQPESSESLHQLSSENNQYIQAIQQILGILQYFNTENKFILYGFGAKLPPFYNIVSHCFACNGNIFDPYIIGGIEDVIKIYKESLQAVTFHGPTIFSQIIDQAIQFSQSEKIDQLKQIQHLQLNDFQSQKYYVLLILSDGNVNDINAITDQLYKAQDCPLSIIIVGIGNEDFKSMRQLDADETKLHSKTYSDYVNRDIVQFVEFNQCKNNQEKLTKEVLAEIPRQFLEYMEANKIYPIKGKKNSKAATNEFIHIKIEEMRKIKKKEFAQNIIKLPLFLKQKKDDFIKLLLSLGYKPQYVVNIINDGIPTNDVNLVIELISEYQQQEQKSQQMKPISISHKINDRNDIAPSIRQQLRNDNVGHRIFRIRQTNKLDELLQLKKQEGHLITKQFLSNLEKTKITKNQEDYPQVFIDTNNFRRKLTPIQKNNQQPKQRSLINYDNNMDINQKFTDLKEYQTIENLCLDCRENKIQLVFIPCGHACSCYQCYIDNAYQHCLSCNQKVQMFARISDNK